MTKPTLALDFDGVIARTHETALRLLDGRNTDYSGEDIDSWQWGIEEFGDRFLPAVWHSWTIAPQDIEPNSDNLAEEIEWLSQYFVVDIVTAHPRHHDLETDDMIARSKKAWLADRIDTDHVNDFVVVEMGTSKMEGGYEYYIDDKPSLPEKVADSQTVYLYDRPWNKDAGGDYTRVESLTEALKYYKIENIRENVKDQVKETLAEELI